MFSETEPVIPKAPVLTNLKTPTQVEKAQPLPPKYNQFLEDKIHSKKNDSTYRYKNVLTLRESFFNPFNLISFNLCSKLLLLTIIKDLLVESALVLPSN